MDNTRTISISIKRISLGHSIISLRIMEKVGLVTLRCPTKIVGMDQRNSYPDMPCFHYKLISIDEKPFCSTFILLDFGDWLVYQSFLDNTSPLEVTMKTVFQIVMESSRKITQQIVLFLVLAFKGFQPVKHWSLSLANLMQENALYLLRSESYDINKPFHEVDMTKSIGNSWRIAK